jgi:hypothetical protein
LLSFLLFGFASGGVQAGVPSRYEANLILLNGTHQAERYLTRENRVKIQTSTDQKYGHFQYLS